MVHLCVMFMQQVAFGFKRDICLQSALFKFHWLGFNCSLIHVNVTPPKVWTPNYHCTWTMEKGTLDNLGKIKTSFSVFTWKFRWPSCLWKFYSLNRVLSIKFVFDLKGNQTFAILLQTSTKIALLGPNINNILLITLSLETVNQESLTDEN